MISRNWKFYFFYCVINLIVYFYFLRYIPQFVVLKPNTRLLCQMYFFKSPDKILYIRPDTLAQILTWSNVQAGSKVLLMETCKGLLAGALMDRLGVDGTLVQIHQGNNPMRTVVEQYNFTVDDADRLLCSFPLEKIENFKEMDEQKDCSREEKLEAILGKKYITSETTTGELKQNPADSTASHETKSNNLDGQLADQTMPEQKSTADVPNSLMEIDNPTDLTKSIVKPEESVTRDEKPTADIPSFTSDNVKIESELQAEETTTSDQKDIQAKSKRNDRKRKQGNDSDWKPALPRVTYLSKEKRVVECEKAMKLLSEKQFDSLVIAAKYHPKNILLSLLEFLPPSRPFVVYCQQMEPLMDCFVALKDMKIAVHVELTESWYRNLQVLSNRTHPEIVMSATGGYLLRGIKVKP